MVLVRTHTRTHEAIYFADPYKACNQCGRRIQGVIVVDDGPDLVIPCEHDKGYKDLCPSWSPVNGCTCPEGH